METFRYRKSRIWEMKENKITISLAKNQVCALFYIRDIRKNDPKLSSFVWRRHVCVPFRGANMAAGNQQKHLLLSFPPNA